MRDSIKPNLVKLQFSTRDVDKIINNIHIGEQSKKKHISHKPKAQTEEISSITNGETSSENPFLSLYKFPNQMPFGQIRGANPLADIESQNLRRIGDEERQKIQKLSYMPLRQITYEPSQQTSLQPFRETVSIEEQEDDFDVPSGIQEFTNSFTDETPEQEQKETVIPIPPSFEPEEPPFGVSSVQEEPSKEMEITRLEPQKKMARDIPSLFKQQQQQMREKSEPKPVEQPLLEQQQTREEKLSEKPKRTRLVEFKLNPDIGDTIQYILISNQALGRTNPDYFTKPQIIQKIMRDYKVEKRIAELHYNYISKQIREM